MLKRRSNLKDVSLHEIKFAVQANPSMPEQEWQIEHAYGYRTHDANQNCRYTADGKIVYMTAALGVIMDPTTTQQQFYGGKQVTMEAKRAADETEFHRDDILSLDVSVDRKVVVTG
jgi:hypothetical protein